ncbi:outer membrane lipoprotein-sorting protein [Paenibacillus shirakamiensis]|uniref:Outer membrane lipoprotein-sorting protein n=1 Tax=Paenibacillus shirakamiensis TaxID=1265935 RepID=A0ABS4JFU2_9BACL|nr:outer membrane lipoprotein carrier protein LolA [Paenibacillus shirakamiensis]MBP2000578.1 outer membrane lipoprotein-sorting protein [Paenibacillus shirakamiensis]
MRRITWILTIVIAFSLTLAGCGKKDSTDVVKDLDQVVNKLESYEGSGTMTLHTGDKPQNYKVVVWYQNPSYYRIALTNEQKDITQIVLRNDQGVYVLTPSLNKSFRFQSDWPDNQGQVYLYQTLVHSILADTSRQFVTEGNNYVFDVAANYNTQSLVRQKIWLNKKDYAPQKVQVSDSSNNVVVEVNFDSFKFDAPFDKKSFDMQQNLNASTPDTKGTLLEVDEKGQLVETPSTNDSTASNDQKTLSDQNKSTDPSSTSGAVSGESSAKLPALDEPFGVVMPTYNPEGTQKKDEKVVTDSKNSAVLLRYDGQYQYTLSESRALDRAVSLAKDAQAIDLGFTVGYLAGTDLQTLTWTVDGLQFNINSDNLPVNEMIQIAASMQDQTGK